LKYKLTPRAFVELKTAHNPQVSPDGRRVVFEVHEPDLDEGRYVSRLWLADTAEVKPRQITFAWESDHDPRWSPDGKNIAFISTRPDLTQPPPPEEEENPPKEQVWILPADGGEAYRLTNTREGVRDFRWTPDSAAIIFLTSEARLQPMQFAHDDARKRKVDPVVEHQDKLRRQFWVVSLEDRKPEMIYTGDFGISEFEVSPDGKRLVFNTNYTGEPNDYHQYDLHLLELETEEEPRRLTDRPGSETSPRWSPDGDHIAFLSAIEPAMSYSQDCVWTVPATGGSPRNLFESVDYDAEEIAWARDGKSLLAIVADRTRNPLVRIDIVGTVRPMTDAGPISCGDLHAGESGAVVAIAEDDRSVPEVYLFEQDGERRALTEFGKDFLERYELPRIEVVRWQSDGGEIEGLLVYPSNYEEGRRYPLIAQIHGGPKGHAQNTLRSYYQHPVWAAEGYVILQPNFRGSAGYGNAFATANRRDLGGGDFRDIMAGVDHVIELGIADPERMGIMGGSYGGYMANWAIGHTDRFAAAISKFGMFSLITSTANSELSRWELEYLGAPYWEDPEIYRQCSPSTYVDRIKTPVLIIHGEGDANTFISNSKEMYQALRARGVTVEFAHYPREGHGLREPGHKLDEMRRCLAWFDRFLKPAERRYRASDKIEHDGYELMLVRAEDIDFGWGDDPEAPRLLEVALSLASRDAVDAAWELALEDIALTGPEGTLCALRGVPTDFGGGRSLVEGEKLTIVVPPDKDTGRLGVAPVVVYEIPEEGGNFELRVGDFPPIAFEIGPKEEKSEGEEHHEPKEHGGEHMVDPKTALGAPEPIVVPQRPE
jgi:dipeptidyl aminopeptidase/acylaminoacyl peptidase